MTLHVDYHRPRTLDEARDLKATLPGSRFIAGGTDLVVRMRSGRDSARALISLRSIPQLAGVGDNGLTRIGAGTCFTDILRHRSLCSRYPVLGQAVRTLGSVQIRNVATIGGNLCNAIPCADSAVALLVLDAKLSILGVDGSREIPVEELFVGPRETSLAPGEILTTILIDAPTDGQRGVFLKKMRVARDLALASVAVRADTSGPGGTLRDVRVAAGSVAPTPLRLRKVESLIEGRRITPEILSRACELAREGISPISDVRASADYRRHVTGVLLARAVEAVVHPRSA